MSQICRYYLRGSCKYGHRCHFLHEDPYGNNSSDYSQGYYQNYQTNNHSRNYSKDYSQNYSSDHWQNYTRAHTQNYNRGHSQNYAKDQSQNYNRDYIHTSTGNYSENYGRSSRSDHSARNHSSGSNFTRNFNRYHIDNRENQRESKNPADIGPEEFLEILNLELTQHEQSHMWPLTVISPVKDFGNIPQFKDCSPEEVRYQYYESLHNNAVHDFEKAIRETQDDITRCRQMFKSKSSEVYNIVKCMMEQKKNPQMATSFSTPAASTFSFDVTKLHETQPSVNMNSSTPAFSFNTNHDVFSTYEVNTPIFQNSNNILNGTENFPPNQPQSQLNTFSFNLNNTNFNQENVTTQPATINVFSNSRSISDVNDTIYSNLANLPAQTVELFQAKTFKAGKVPLVSPPKELCLS